MKLLIENWRKFLCEADEYDIDIRTAQSGYTPPPPPEEPTGGDPKTLAYFIFAGPGSSAMMQDGTRFKMQHPHYDVGYESELADLLKQKDLTNIQLSTDQLPASVYVNFPDGTKRKYNKNTGEKGEEFE